MYGDIELNALNLNSFSDHKNDLLNSASNFLCKFEETKSCIKPIYDLDREIQDTLRLFG